MPTPALERARGVADAVLYEGYLLYPYRRSSGKNRVRWQFGVLAPRPWIEAQGPVVDGVAGSTESWWQQTEVLIEPPAGGADRAELAVRLRFLQLQEKQVERADPDGRYRPVGEVEVDGARHLSFSEAVPREVDLEVGVPADLVENERAFRVEVGGGTEVEPLVDASGRPTARIRRIRRAVSAAVFVSAARCPSPFPLLRLRVRIENALADVDTAASRDVALRQALVATHTLLQADGVRFLSLLDPPEWATEAARVCRNVRTFPVLVGEPGTSSTVLSSPILLYDHPQIAPESPGDLHDAAEIDEILSLRTLTLSDEEKREVRGTDARGAAILDRVEGMPPEVLERLHGAVRGLRAVDRPGDPEGRGWSPTSGTEDDEDGVPWWEPGGDADVSPETDTVLVNGSVLARGSRVRLRPRLRGSDAHDMFLAGRSARIEKVLLDVDGSRFLAVAIDDDPGADLHQWYGRLRHFRPDEVEPLGDAEALG